MRTIKFRGQSLTSNEWFYGLPAYSSNYSNLNDIVDVVDDEYVKIHTVGQFTGLTEENGIELYEGDIFTTRNGYNYFIVFEDGAFQCYHCNHKDTINGGMLRWGLLSRAYELGGPFIPKKIGNIHDNPELLK